MKRAALALLFAAAACGPPERVIVVHPGGSDGARRLFSVAMTQRITLLDNFILRPDEFAAVTIPVLTWEAWLFDDLGLGTNAGETTATGTTVAVPATGHPITRGLPASLQISNVAQRVSSVVAAGEAVSLGTAFGRDAIVVAESGAALTRGRVAPARRVALPFGYNTPRSLTVAGMNLFDQAVDWALA